MDYESKVLAHELLIKRMAERMDRLEETAYKCGDKRKRSQEEYVTPSPNLGLIADEIRDNNETDWNKEDSPTPAPEPSKKREKKRPRVETISPESTPEPALRAKDKKTPDVQLFDRNAAKFKEFLSKLETYFRMQPESYLRKDFNGKILYTSMRLTGSASNWWMANEKKLDTSMPGHWTSCTDFVEELRKSFGNTHALEDARTKLTRAQQVHSQSMAEFIAYCRKLQLEAQLPVDQLWSTLLVGVKDKEVREHLIRIREYGRYKGPRLEETCFDDMLSAGKHVESNKESERRIQQARDGHKKSSTKDKSHEKGTGAGVKKHYKKSKPAASKEASTTTAKPAASGSKKTFTRKSSTSKNTSKISQEEEDRRGDNNLCYKCGKDGHTYRDCPNKKSVEKPKEKEAPKTKSVKKIQTYQAKSKGKPSLKAYGVIEEDSSSDEN